VGKDEMLSLVFLDVKAQRENNKAFNTERTEQGCVSKNPGIVFR
jgi:hypothetical protein